MSYWTYWINGKEVVPVMVSAHRNMELWMDLRRTLDEAGYRPMLTPQGNEVTTTQLPPRHPVFGPAEWWSAPRTWRDVARCVLGLHRPAVEADTAIGRVQRCTCGAFGPRPWFYGSRSESREKWRTR